MTTKLTLSIDEEVIRKAKQASLSRGKSLSKLVEEYLRTISRKEIENESGVKKLSGVLKDKIPANAAIKSVKGRYLRNKYGL